MGITIIGPIVLVRAQTQPKTASEKAYPRGWVQDYLEQDENKCGDTRTLKIWMPAEDELDTLLQSKNCLIWITDRKWGKERSLSLQYQKSNPEVPGRTPRQIGGTDATYWTFWKGTQYHGNHQFFASYILEISLQQDWKQRYETLLKEKISDLKQLQIIH